MTITSAVGFWDLLSALENAQTPELVRALKPFAQLTANCYECGVEVPTLPHKHGKTADINVAGLFLKRSLNDLRAIWNLLAMGYTSQAGAVAASAFENALVVTCVAGNLDRSNKLLKSESVELPWSVADMCKMHIQQLNENRKSSKAYSEKGFEDSWTALYAHYVWLCMVKHPTVQSAVHDAFSIKIDEHQYGIMAAPDTRPEDLPNKAMVLVVTINRIVNTIDDFAKAYGVDNKDPRVVSWQRRLDSIFLDIDKAMEPLWHTQPPIGIGSSRFARQYQKKRRRIS